MRKVPVIVKMPGRISVQCVPIMPRRSKITNFGMIVICDGIIIVDRYSRNTTSRPRNLIFAKA